MHYANELDDDNDVVGMSNDLRRHEDLEHNEP